MTNQTQKSFLKSLIQIPWTTRTYLLTIIALFCLDYYNQKWAYLHLSSNFFITVLRYEVWRALINFVYEPNLVMIVLILIHLGIFLPRFERQNGSIVTLYEIVTIGYLVQFFSISYQTLVYLLNDNKVTEDWKVTFNIGASGVMVNMFIKFLYFNVKQADMKCSKRAMLTYFYPLVLVCLGNYVSAQYRVDMIAGYLLAIVECIIFKGGILFYTPNTYTEKQKAVYFCRLPGIPCCNWSNLNEEKIKPNRLLVVQAHQFYTLKNYASVNKVGNIDLSEEGIQTQRGVLRNNSNRMVQDDISVQNRGEKWEKQQIIEDQ